MFTFNIHLKSYSKNHLTDGRYLTISADVKDHISENHIP